MKKSAPLKYISGYKMKQRMRRRSYTNRSALKAIKEKIDFYGLAERNRKFKKLKLHKPCSI
jgi:hypothetical protein